MRMEGFMDDYQEALQTLQEIKEVAKQRQNSERKRMGSYFNFQA